MIRKIVAAAGVLFALIFMPQGWAEDNVRIIPFKISSQMWYQPEKKLIPTPPAIIEKIKQSFDLWASVKEVQLGFRYDGLVNANYKGFHQVPHDGTIYVILNNWDMGNCNDGLSQHWGEIPGNYKGGGSVINTKKGIHTARADILTHEIGHALGIDLHGASPSNVLCAAGNAWNIQEYFFLSEQDRANLIAKWKPDFQDLYLISGKVHTAVPEQKTDERKMASVFAVNIKNGHTYSAKTDQTGDFTIALLKAGDYRIFAKAFEAFYYQKPAPQSPSWYIADGQSTNDPYSGTVLHVNSDHRHIKDLSIQMIDRPVPFNLFNAGETYGKDSPYCFMRPGAQTRLQIEYKGLVSVESYGEHPDYSLSHLEEEPQFKETCFANVSVDPEAEPGERLVIAKGQPGEMIQAGLVGVNVVDALPARISRGSLQEIDDQIKGKKPDPSEIPTETGETMTMNGVPYKVSLLHGKKVIMVPPQDIPERKNK